MRTVAILALPDVIAFDLATPIEMFGRARLPGGEPAYRVLVCSDAADVDAGPMRLIPGDDLGALQRANTIMVPGSREPERAVPAPMIAALQESAARGTTIASICVGAFALAQAGLLDGRRATTHWAAVDLFRDLYPPVLLEPSAMFVRDGAVFTSAGAAAGLDLCLELIRIDYGMAVAADAARSAVMPLYREGGQAPFILSRRSDIPDDSLAGLLDWLDGNAHRDLTLGDLATRANMSVRTLNRRFQEQLGSSPMAALLGVRVRRARELLESTGHPIERIAHQVGFGSAVNLRIQFKRAVGMSPQAYRQAFRAEGERRSA